jgi:flagellar basal-body rod modification protein FlgD
MNVYMRDALPRATASGDNSNPLLEGGDSSQFMQMLITELQAQDPMSPMDTSTMVTQLTQLNTLDQVTQIRGLLQSATGLEIG